MIFHLYSTGTRPGLPIAAFAQQCPALAERIRHLRRALRQKPRVPAVVARRHHILIPAAAHIPGPHVGPVHAPRPQIQPDPEPAVRRRVARKGAEADHLRKIPHVRPCRVAAPAVFLQRFVPELPAFQRQTAGRALALGEADLHFADALARGRLGIPDLDTPGVLRPRDAGAGGPGAVLELVIVAARVDDRVPAVPVAGPADRIRLGRFFRGRSGFFRLRGFLRRCGALAEAQADVRAEQVCLDPPVFQRSAAGLAAGGQRERRPVQLPAKFRLVVAEAERPAPVLPQLQIALAAVDLVHRRPFATVDADRLAGVSPCSRSRDSRTLRAARAQQHAERRQQHPSCIPLHPGPPSPPFGRIPVFSSVFSITHPPLPRKHKVFAAQSRLFQTAIDEHGEAVYNGLTT